MKQCPTCQEKFANEFGFCPFGFCPVDGAQLKGIAGERTPEVESAAEESGLATPGEFRPTIIDDEGPVSRIPMKVLRGVWRLAWPEFKRGAGSGDENNVRVWVRWYARHSLFLCLETGYIYLLFQFHYWFEDLIAQRPCTPLCIIIRLLLYALLVRNAIVILRRLQG
jgi:hypothetical protein